MSVDVRLIPARVHGRVLVRAASRPSSRFLFGFHGYMENADVQMARLLAIPGSDAWTLVSVQALHAFYRGRSEDVVASWMTRQDRERAIEDNVHYVNAAIADVTRDATDPRIVHVGFSQGGAMAYRAAARGNIAAAGVVVAGADVPLELLADATVRFPPTLVIRGERDEWFTASKLETDLAALLERRVDVRTAVLDGGHEWDDGVARVVGEFLQQVV